MMCKSLVFGSILLTLLLGVKAASTSRLQIQLPKELKKEDGYDHREALFGIPPYGGSIQQQVYYTDQSLCDGNLDKTKGFPARENGAPLVSPFILMINRGGCTFVEKVRHAQRAGAAGVLIADNTCQCSAENCTSESSVLCEMTEPVMADDGSGSDISIPSFLLFKQDADPIKDTLKANNIVRVEMKFSLPTPDSRVEYDFWTTPKDFTSRNIEGNFKSAALALGKDAFFTPHMYIYDGETAGCRNSLGHNDCFTLCTNSGRYCATDPDDDLESGLSGADVVKESLRRMCVWKKYGVDGIGREWWDYVEEFMYRCDNEEENNHFTSENCVADAMSHANVDKSAIDQCMQQSGGLDGDVSNTMLDAELANREKSGVVLIPSLYINKAPIRGEMAYVTTFRAICAGYAAGYEPKVCLSCMNCPDTQGCVERGYCSVGGGGATGTVSGGAFFGAMFGLTMFFVIVGVVLYRRQQRYMRDHVRGIMAEYMPVDENKTVDNSLALDDEEGEFTIS